MELDGSSEPNERALLAICFKLVSCLVYSSAATSVEFQRTAWSYIPEYLHVFFRGL
jgi:hypothetical protein